MSESIERRTQRLTAMRATTEGKYCASLIKPFGSYGGRARCYVCSDEDWSYTHFAGVIVCLPCWIGACTSSSAQPQEGGK